MRPIARREAVGWLEKRQEATKGPSRTAPSTATRRYQRRAGAPTIVAPNGSRVMSRCARGSGPSSATCILERGERVRINHDDQLGEQRNASRAPSSWSAADPQHDPEHDVVRRLVGTDKAKTTGQQPDADTWNRRNAPGSLCSAHRERQRIERREPTGATLSPGTRPRLPTLSANRASRRSADRT